MSLASDANKLLLALQAIVSCSENYADKHENKYISGYVSFLKPLVAQYAKAIKIKKSKDLAQLVLTEIAPQIERISAASSKGEMDIFENTNTALEDYWELYTIFRESKYNNEIL